MNKNVGNTDRIVRIVIGLLIGIFGIVYKSWWGLLAIVPFATAFMNFCPLYSIFKINTKK